MEAWVITYNKMNPHKSNDNYEVVVGLLPARKSPEQHMNFLYVMFLDSVEKMLPYIKNRLPLKPPEMQIQRNGNMCLIYDDGSCLIAKKVNDIATFKNNNKEWLRWIEPEYNLYDKNNPMKIAGVEPRKNNKAVVLMPLF